MTCPNCGALVFPDELIESQEGIGKDTHWVPKCDYCIED